MDSGNQMVIDQLNSDPNYLVDFIIDNNPTEVQAHLSSLNLLSGTPQGDTMASLRADVRAIDDAETLREVLSVPYNNQATNYTGGLEYELSNPNSPIGGGAKDLGAVWGQVLNGVFSVGSSYLDFMTMQEQGQITSETLEAQAEMNQANLDAQLEALRLQEIAEEKRKILGLNPTIFLSILGAITIILVFAFATKK